MHIELVILELLHMFCRNHKLKIILIARIRFRGNRCAWTHMPQFMCFIPLVMERGEIRNDIS